MPQGEADGRPAAVAGPAVPLRPAGGPAHVLSESGHRQLPTRCTDEVRSRPAGSWVHSVVKPMHAQLCGDSRGRAGPAVAAAHVWAGTSGSVALWPPCRPAAQSPPLRVFVPATSPAWCQRAGCRHGSRLPGLRGWPSRAEGPLQLHHEEPVPAPGLCAGRAAPGCAAAAPPGSRP